MEGICYGGGGILFCGLYQWSELKVFKLEFWSSVIDSELKQTYLPRAKSVVAETPLSCKERDAS